MSARPRLWITALCATLGLSACVEGGSPTFGPALGFLAPPDAEMSTAGLSAPMRWDHTPYAETWTETAFAALDAHGTPLANVLPADIESWCPAYPDADVAQRNAFWVGLISTLAKHESTWNQRAVGGGGRWFGLVQIAPATARGYGCEARTGEALKDGALNLNCAIRIMAVTVPRDNVVSAGMRGVAADWGPFHSARKREDMREWVRNQAYCAL